MLSAVNTEQILAAIDAEVARLQEVRALLGDTSTTKRRGRPPGSATKAAPAKRVPKKRVLSAEARAKIAEAQRKRWAKSKKIAKKRTPKKKQATVTVTKVAAKKAPVRRQPQPVAREKTALSGSVPGGPVAAAAPAK
jgi:hypothetical protein